MSESQKIVLVDGSSYLFRAFYALPHLTNDQGEPTGAILGVINMLQKIPRQLKTDHIAVVFDSKGKNFRYELYPEYKANRKVIADELKVQITPVHEMVKKLGFPLIVIDGVEADDVIGTLAVRFSKEGYQVVISTSDKDMAQLVDSKVTLIDTMKNEVTDREKVIAKFGVAPEQIVDYLALVGDVSDNIPGVPQVGPKTAVKWLNKYQSLSGVKANADKITGKVGESLRNNIKILPLSYQLATIKCDVNLSYTVKDMHCKAWDVPYLKKAFIYYGFKGWLRDLEEYLRAKNKKQDKIPKTSQLDYQVILDQESLSKLCQQLVNVDIFAFDVGNNRSDGLSADIVGISFSLKPYHSVYIPLQHDYPDVPKQLPMIEFFQEI